mgnify:CR=1 FL=1
MEDPFNNWYTLDQYRFVHDGTKKQNRLIKDFIDKFCEKNFNHKFKAYSIEVYLEYLYEIKETAKLYGFKYDKKSGGFVVPSSYCENSCVIFLDRRLSNYGLLYLMSWSLSLIKNKIITNKYLEYDRHGDTKPSDMTLEDYRKAS